MLIEFSNKNHYFQTYPTYEFSKELQKEAHYYVLQSNDYVLLGGQYQSPVITLGIRSHRSQDILWSEEKIMKHNISIEPIRRGGEATLHSPGQLVIYPVVNLARLKIGIREFISILNQVTVLCLNELGCVVESSDKEPGLYTAKGKVVFYGLSVSRGVTQHGLSINMKNDLKLFDSIRSCGTIKPEMDSVNNYSAITQNKLFDRWSKHFCKELQGYVSLP